MAWSDGQLGAFKAKIHAARRQGLWLTPEELRLVADLVQAYRASLGRGAPDGRLPTIAHMRQHGVSGCLVTCRTPGCRNRRRFSFDDLGFDAAMPFVLIPEQARFVCRLCKGRRVEVHTDRPEPLGYRPPW